MWGNCSTRDGRSRVAAPTAPHVTWTTRLPTDSTGQVGLSAVATDASGHAYVVTTGEIDLSVAALRRVRGTDGAIEWTSPIRPDTETGTPILLSQGGVDLFAYDNSSRDSVFTFDPSSGASTSTTFGVSLYYAPGNLAVGADGSLYVTHKDDVGGANTTTFISRIAPDGRVVWTSVDLKTLGPPANSVANAFDARTGAVRWSTTLPGQVVGGPVVRSDGTIVALLDRDGTTALVLVDPRTGAPETRHLATGAFEILGVTEGDVVIAGADTGSGVTGLVAIASDGTTLWTSPAGQHATIAADGTILAFGPNITAIDGSNGATKWQQPPPAAGSCIADAALTSEGGIVALQCDGTLFGASD
jgi:hypothetical protein